MSLREYLVTKKKEIEQLDVKEREKEILQTKSVATSIIGPRRAGKSFFLFYIIKKKKLEENDYVYVNFEEDEVKHFKREEKVNVIKYHVEEYGKEPSYLFFDEIQNLKRWESFVYSLIEKKRYYIFLTGSSSKLLSKEIATQLRGRTLSQTIFPFNFREYLSLHNLKIPKHLSSYDVSKIKANLKDYLRFSGFPQILIDRLPPKQFLKEYVDLVVFKDIVERYGIENLFAIRYLIQKEISNFSKEFSINKVYNELKSQGIKIGKGTLYSYSVYLEDVMFGFLLKKFSFSEKETMLSVPKVYLCDHGIPNFSLTRFSIEFGRLMENLVFTELKQQEFERKIDLFYFKDYQQHEVDFVIKQGLRVNQLIQVTYASGLDEIEKRELRSLVKAGELLQCKDLLVITWDLEDQIEFKDKTIKFIPLWKWLLKVNP